ncbi:MAG: hypothetical protein WCJ72_09485 [Chryseobacterium sp.]
MPLDKNTLKTKIEAILSDMETKDVDSKEEFAQRLSDAIEVFVKSGTVAVATGIPVTTSSGSGSTSGEGVGTIS